MNRDRLKVLGFYVLAALIIARIVIAPLQHSLQEKKSLLREYEEAYRMRTLSFEKYKEQEAGGHRKDAPDARDFMKSLYGSDIVYSALQSELVEKISEMAAKEGLTLVSFEFAEPTALKAISEVPVVIRVSGEQKSIIALLEDLDRGNMKLVVRRFDNTKNGPYSAQCAMTISAFRLER